MANVYLLNLSQETVTMGNVFSTEKSYLYKNTTQYSSAANYAYTKTLESNSLRLYQETQTGIKITDYSQISKRENIGPAVPVSGPFIENYSVNGDLNTNNFINLLLIDKPPVRTGFFQFFIGGETFNGVITKQTKYTYYNWEQVGAKYVYTEQPDDLGYAIEISRNLLYTANLVNGVYEYIPTALNLFLRNLSGNEEIISTPTTINPNTYLNSIPGEPAGTSGVLPINLFYISPADALRYIASYSDLIATFGADFTKGQLHYANERGDRTITFDPITYLNKYSDLRSAYGYDTYAATIHYITTGYNEGRTLDGSSASDPQPGGLYDERSGSINLQTDLIIWPQGETLAGDGSTLTYKYNTTEYFLNGNAPLTGNLVYLGIQ
jgi:hypothetical protein